MPNESKKSPTPALPPTVHETLTKVRHQLYHVELTASLLSLAFRVFWLFFAAILLDHWVLPSGMGYPVRVLCWLLLAGGILAYVVKTLWPFILSRIHPLYAADTIEREYPQLKNNLLNLLFLRTERGENAHRRFRKTDSERVLQERIIQSLENQAEADLKVLSPKLTVDFDPILKRSYLLVLAFFVFGVYLALSPKSPWTSISRVLFPLSPIEAPTRVRILEVRPGDTTLFQGDTLNVTAQLKNVREGESVQLVYTTEDRQTVDFPLNMKQKDRNRFSVSKPDVRQAMTWQIVCGDAASRVYHVKVLPPLTVQVEHVTLEPPAYTGQARRTQDAGDFSAIEGTLVTIEARANQPAKSAMLEILPVQDDTPIKRLTMQRNAEGTGLSVRFPLERTEVAKSMGSAEKFRYRIRFETASGAKNLRPALHQMDVTADSAPEIRLLEAPEDGATVPENGTIEIQLEARDPDFGLRGVAFRARWNDQPLDSPAILNTPKEITTNYRATFHWKPSSCRLHAGDSIVWWVEAKDNRQPEGNRTRTELRRMEITAVESAGGSASKPDSREKPDEAEGSSEEPGETPDGEDGSSTTEKKNEPATPDSPDGEKDDAQSQSGDGEEEAGTPSPDDSGNASDSEGEAGSNSGSVEKQGSGESSGSSDGSGGDSSSSDDGGDSQSGNPDSGNSNSGDSQSGEGTDGETNEKEPAPRPDMPRTAPQAFDPLDERAERDEPQSGESSDSQKGEGNKQEGSDENSGEDSDAQGSQKSDGQQSGNESDGQDGESQESGESTGEKPGKGADEKSQGESGTSGEKLNPDEQAGQSSENDGSQNEQTDEQKVGSDTGSESETSEGTPMDNGENSGSEGAEGDDEPQPGDGSQKGKSPSKQPKGTKPNGGETDGEGLQESDGSSQNREKRDGDTGNADTGSSSSSPIDPQANPGEAFEQILEHQKSQPSQPNQGKPQDSQRGEDSESDPSSTADGSNSDSAGDFDLQNGTMEQAAESSDETQQGKSSNRTGNDSQAGGDSKTHNDRMTDNAVESGSKNEKNKGGNKNGGQDDSNQQGIGRAGNNTAEKEGNPSGSGGDGPKGQKGGKGQKTDQQTGVTQEDAEGRSDSQSSGKQGSDASQGKTSQNAKSSSKKGEASSEASDDPEQNTLQGSNGGMGKQPGRTATAGPQADPKEAENADAANLDFTRQQTLLALNHLQDMLNEGDDTLLERLGWTREQAQAFLKHWLELHQKDQNHQLTKAEQQKFEKDLRSLGLQRTTEFQNETRKDKSQRRVRDARRLAVPESWREQVEAYSKGVSE